MRHFEVKLKRSAYHWPKSQCETLKTLGLTKFGKTVYLKDTPAVRGILYKVVHAIEVAAHDGPPPKSHRQQRLRGCT
ncbi:MAG: 50S ribosomal protein L30 [Deltaproteobacteria bacterium]|nr:50S ribosomal protein L30 [Deltaproteobacteria bacterium]